MARPRNRLCGAVVGLAVGAAALAGCARPVVEAPFTSTPIVIDGRLDKPIWRQAPPYELDYSWLDQENTYRPPERCLARCAWDQKFFYLAVECEDRDIVARGDRDGQRHYELGDCCEVFLHPEGKPYYWEIHLTPRGRHSVYFNPVQHGARDPLPVAQNVPVVTAGVIDGTLNKRDDVDRGWTAELAVPLAELTRLGDRFDASAKWGILIGRYDQVRPPEGASDRPAGGMFADPTTLPWMGLDVPRGGPDGGRGPGVGATSRPDGAGAATRPGGRRGPGFGGGRGRFGEWRFREITSFPKLPRPSFHDLDRFAELHLASPPGVADSPTRP
jgi:hypothetical protein